MESAEVRPGATVRGTALPMSASGGAGQRFALSAEQQRVYDILVKKTEPQIAKMYEGCLLVLNCVEHDEKLPLAAHAAREIFRRIPDHFGVRWEMRHLKGELQNLKAKYKRWHPRFSKSDEMPETNPHQDANLRDFLRYYEYVATYDGGSREEHAARVFAILMPWASPALLQDLAKWWVSLHDYFTRVAHHGSVTSEEFATKLREFQDCVFLTAKPEPVADLDAIDRLIAEGQANGHS